MLRLANRVVGLIPSSGRAVVVRSEPKPPLGPRYWGILKPEINDVGIDACNVPAPSGVFKTAVPILSHTPYMIFLIQYRNNCTFLLHRN